MIDEKILAFNKSMFVVMPYPYAFIYQRKSVPRMNVSGFLNKIVQYTVVAKLASTNLKIFHLTSSHALLMRRSFR